MQTVQSPKLTLSQTSSQQGALVTASGTWQVHALAHDNAIKAIDTQLKPLQGDANASWDLSQIDSMDHIGA
ncbi:ABC transporter permease, partial [Clostridioides difficile]|nr:ABC transporter permease [Clostridioides difficile]